MKIIEKLSDKIEEEINDAKCYVKMALEYKEEHRELADTLFTISNQEMGHMKMLHDQVTAIIEDYRKKNGEPPAAMLAVYDYLHKKQIDKANQVKVYQDMYRG
jgi:ferritin